MSINVKKLTKTNKKKTKMYTLVNVTILSELVKKKKVHRELEEQYKELRNESWIDQTTLTIINAIITQNRKVFILTRGVLEKLLVLDTNHFNKPCLNRNEYDILISTISDKLVSINKIKRGSIYVTVCTVKSKGILKYLTADQAEQEKEIIHYITKNNFKRTSSQETSNLIK